MNTPKKPIKARAAHAARGGNGLCPRNRARQKSNAVPSANRVNISVTGEISLSAALVATNEIPQNTTAKKAAIRGGISVEIDSSPGARRFPRCIQDFNNNHVHLER